MALQHTYASLDSVTVEGETKTMSALAANRDSKFVFNSGSDMFGPKEMTVVPGATYTVTCKRGFSPYKTYGAIKDGASCGARTGETCQAVCMEDGSWFSDCICRCDE